MNSERLEALVQKVRSLPDEDARDTALELVQAVMDLHATGLDRMMQLVSESESSGALLESFSREDAVSALLLLHDLHPLELETRVRRAVESPSLAIRGGSVHVVSVNEGTVRVRVEGGPSFEALVRSTILEAAPDAGEIVVESEGPPMQAGFVPLTQLLAG